MADSKLKSKENSVHNFTIFGDSNEKSQHLVDRISSAFFLVTLGLIFLLNTNGILPWGIWASFGLIIANIWPVFLILLGINIIIGESTLAKIISAILWYVLFIAIFAVAIYAQSHENLKTLIQTSQISSVIQGIFNK